MRVAVLAEAALGAGGADAEVAQVVPVVICDVRQVVAASATGSGGEKREVISLMVKI